MADSRAGWIALNLIPGIGSDTYRRLLHAFGAPEEVYSASLAALEGVVNASIAHAIRAGVDEAAVRPTLDWLDKDGNHLVTLADADYPRALLETADPPPLLYLKGRRALLNAPSLAVVGSRNATPQGLRDAEAFAAALSANGYCVVSGLALGIDAAAHRGALRGAGSTLAVVGTGLDIVYPARNRDLAHEIAQHGAILSEFPLGTPSRAGHFPRRNRLISGLSRGVLVVEAAAQSGSLITARLAGEQGRDVFAIPGSIHSPLSKGCHQLIRQGAKLVESANDILEELQGFAPPPPAENCAPCAAVPAEYAPILAHLGHAPLDADTLAERGGLTADAVCAILLRMELDGLVAALPGGLYQRIT
jgi:DNA processing protein